MRLKPCFSINHFDRTLTTVGLGSTRVDFGQVDASICRVSQVAGIGAYKNNKKLCREVCKLLQRSGESSAEKSGDFSAGVMRFLVLLHEAEQQDDKLSRKDAQKHAERIDCAVAYCGRIACGRLVGKCECRWVGVAAGYQSHQGEVVRLVA